MNHCPAFSLAGEQVFRNPVLVVGNHAVSYVQYLRGGTVVLVQDDILVGGEVHEFRRSGPSPFIDALVRVSHDEDVAVLCPELLYEVPVVGVAVLGLVDHYVIQLVLPFLPCVGEPVQDEQGKVHQVIEIQGVILHLARDETCQVAAFHLVGDHAVREHVGFDITVQCLVGSDSFEKVLDGLLGPLDAELVHALLGKGLGVLFVEDGE